jgi:response regulator RpfG family c-di-GMP phosphodiesterase
MEENQYTLLCVDDEKNILNALKRLLRKEKFRLLTGNSGQEGLEILAENEVHVVLSDQRMPGMNGTEFLKEVKGLYPDILRIILTGYTDVDSISEAINEGHIYKFFLKPWNDHNLKLEIRQAMEQYSLMQDNKRLHDQVFQQNEELKQVNENLEAIIEERTRNLAYQNQALQFSQAVLDDLPLPIMGISSELMVVMANKALYAYMGTGGRLKLGTVVSDFLEPKISQQLSDCLSAKENRRLSHVVISGKATNLELIPLTGRYEGQGLILTLADDSEPCPATSGEVG